MDAQSAAGLPLDRTGTVVRWPFARARRYRGPASHGNRHGNSTHHVTTPAPPTTALAAKGLEVGDILDWETAPLMFSFRDLDGNRFYVGQSSRLPIRPDPQPQRSSDEDEHTSCNGGRGDCPPRHHHGVFARILGDPLLTAPARSSASSTTSETARTSIAPAVSRPLTDFVENEYYHSSVNTGRSDPVPYRGRVAGLPVRGGWGFAHRRRQCAVRVLPPAWSRATRGDSASSGDRPQPCATIIQGRGSTRRTRWDYGQSVTAALSPGRTVTCASAVDGLTCTSADGTGSRGLPSQRSTSFTVI